MQDDEKAGEIMKVLINGKIKEMKKLTLDTGYFYGYGVFETILIREGQAVFLEEHLERLAEALKTLDIKKTVTSEDVEYAIAALRVFNGALKVNVSEDNVIFTVRSLSYTSEQYRDGATLCQSYVYRNPTSPTVGIKSMNYMDNIIEMKRARESGFNDVLFLNYKGDVCETAVANIFAIIDGEVVTPPVASGLLPGVVRRWLIETCGAREQVLTMEELKGADGVFITNSLMGIMKVAAIGDKVLSQSAMTDELTRKYVDYLKNLDENR